MSGIMLPIDSHKICLSITQYHEDVVKVCSIEHGYCNGPKSLVSMHHTLKLGQPDWPTARNIHRNHEKCALLCHERSL